MNEVINFSKIKKPQGKIKIELFDSITGEKTDEVNSTNFISKGVEYVYRLRMMGIFTQYRETGGFDTSKIANDLFSKMVLTTADHAEDPNSEWMIKGKLIGFAETDSTYSGSSKLQGSYNAEESYTNQDKVHIVCDFPTHAGNGTFNSIYFVNKDNRAIDIEEREGYFFKKTKINHYLERRYGTNKWVVTKEEKVGIADDDFNTLNNEIDLDLIHFDVVGNKLYYIKYYDRKKVFKATLPTLNDEVQVVTTNYDLNSIAYDRYRDRFYVGTDKYRNKEGGYDVLIYDNNFNHLDTYKGIEYTDDMLMIDDFLYVCDRYYYNRIYDLDSLESYNIGFYKKEAKFFGYSDSKLYLKSNDENFSIIPKVYIGSRSLLDNPVTKTETNTMKITYDFILPSIF